MRYNSSKEKRKQILGETMNSSSHEKGKFANANTRDVLKTTNVLIKSNRWQTFAKALKKSINTELS